MVVSFMLFSSRNFMYIPRFIVLIVALFSSLYVYADDVPPIEAYGALPEISMMVISPSGDKIAYRHADKGQDYMMVYNRADNKLLGAVELSNIKPSRAYFIDEERLILVVKRSTRLMNYFGRHEVSSAYSYNIKTNKSVQLLTLGFGIHGGQTQLGDIVGLSADGNSVYMPAWTNSTAFSLMNANLDKRKVKRFKRGSKDIIDYFINDNDQLLARERYDNEENLHRVEAKLDGKWIEIFSEKTEIRSKGFVGVTPDFKSLIMLETNSATGHTAYYTMRLKDGMISEPIFSHPDKSVEFVFSDINRIVYGVRYSGFRPSYEFFNKKTNQLIDKLISSMPNNSLRLMDHTPDWSKIIFLLAGDFSKGDYLLYADGKFSSLGSQRPTISPKQVHQIYETEFVARDGLKIPLLLTLPNKELKSLPAILMPHGGPESYDTISFNWKAQYFASRGFLVIQPQFRGSDGFGSDFIRKGHGEWGRKMQHDLTDSVKSLIKSEYVDENKVCIVGSSYGGYAALAGATFTPELYQCAVSINGVSDVKEMLDDEKHDFGSDHWVLSYWEKNIANGKVDKNYLANISPITHVKKVTKPILLIHGEYDDVVPFSQSEDMYEKLKDAGKKVTFLELPKGDHHLSNGLNRMKTLKAIEHFIMDNINTE